MLVHIKEIASRAKRGGYAVGAFNVHNLETVYGVINAAVRAKSPAIIQVSEGAIKYMGLEMVTQIVSVAANDMAPKIPISLHIDHGSTFESVRSCMNAGFSSVHIDASSLPISENIKITKKVVSLAHKKSVWVQGEIGAIIGGHGKVGGSIKGIQLADPEEVVEYVRATKVDAIAAAIGTAHGAFTNEDIRLDLLKEILKKIKTPFVLHGGSGVDDKKIKKAIKEGVRIINIGTDIKVAFSKTLINNCLKNKNETDPRHLLKPTMAAVEEVVYNKMKLFGSAGKA